MRIILTGNPISTQTCYKYTCRGGYVSGYMAERCKTLKIDYKYQIASQYKGKPLKTPLGVKMRLLMGTKRKSDIDNFNKLVFDALTGIVYEDDSQIEELHIIKGYDKKFPRIELEILELSTQ